MARNHSDIWILPSGVELGFRIKATAPIVCLICIKDPKKKPLEFKSVEEFARHYLKEHKRILTSR